MPMSALNAAYEVLKDAGEPLHYEEITKRMLDRRLWETRGNTPPATVRGELSTDIRKRGSASRFQRVKRGFFTAGAPHQTSSGRTDTPEDSGASRSEARPLSFLDAAEKILRESGSNEPISYLEIANKAIEAELIQTEGLTPAASLTAQIGVDIRRREARGERARFVRPERGKIALAPSLPVRVADRIEAQNRHVRAQLLERARQSTPADFEQLVAALLVAMGFEEVDVTSRSRDGGIDVRGILVVADVVRLRMAVQAKRWQQNVPRPVVQQVRGSLGAHEQGLIITTSSFSQGARKEAERPDASPVALVDGKQLALLLAEKEIGAKRDKYDLPNSGCSWTPSAAVAGTRRRQPPAARRRSGRRGCDTPGPGRTGQ